MEPRKQKSIFPLECDSLNMHTRTALQGVFLGRSSARDVEDVAGRCQRHENRMVHEKPDRRRVAQGSAASISNIFSYHIAGHVASRYVAPRRVIGQSLTTIDHVSCEARVILSWSEQEKATWTLTLSEMQRNSV